MANFRRDLEKEIASEPVEAVVIGAFGWDGFRENGRDIDEDKKLKLLTWKEAAPLLDYEYDPGYGAPDCHHIRIWTKNRVISICEHEGMTTIFSLDRNPRTPSDLTDFGEMLGAFS